MECRPFYQDNAAPIWYGRVEGMQPVNQKLYVYGYVTSKLTENYQGELLHMEFSMQMRAKNADDEIWNYLNPDEPFQDISFTCDGASELCTYFPVGYIPEINYEMYDVAVQVKPNDQLVGLEQTSVNFHIAWVSPEFTAYQLGFRTFFTIASLLILCFYCTKILCRVPVQLQRQLTFEQRGALSLAFLLFLFNDPLYPVHIYQPSFLTFALTEFCSALFISALLIYWLRELAGFRPQKAP